MKKSEFQWISANIVTGNGKPLAAPYYIKDFDGFRVGVIGLTTLRTEVIASPDASLTFLDEVETAQKYVDMLRNDFNVNVVIVLGHLGSVEEAEGQNTSLAVAENVEGIDLIIDGHSHTKMDAPLVVNGTPIVSANEWGKIMGEGTLTIVDGAVTGFDWTPVEITTEKSIVYRSKFRKECILNDFKRISFV